ncbi:MAG: glycosyltransferase family 4 protein [Actinobacteria bacterium]|nr:glycosyltransferase family 4 protein [Actinomycetota bacterium]
MSGPNIGGAEVRRPLRVALMCPYSLSLFGGVQLQVLGLARALRTMGVDARVVAPSDGPPPGPGIISVGPTRRYPQNGSIAPIASGRAVANRTLEALRSFTPDVLHLHEPFSPGANHAAILGTEIPAVGTFHAAYPGRNGWYDALRVPLRRVIQRLAVCTAVSDEAMRNIEATFDVPCDILPNGVEIDTFASAEPWPTSRPAVFFVGRHEPRKGLPVLIDAFSRVTEDAVLWVAGSGPETDALQARGPRDGRIEWLGVIDEDEKARRLRGATVACFPSIEGESFGVVLLEAMAAGAAVVASDLTGYRDVSSDGRDVLLVPPGDPAALAVALERALGDKALRAALVAAGNTRAKEFGMGQLAESFLERYDAAIGGAVGRLDRRSPARL